MAVEMRYGVVYEVVVKALDTASNKQTTNVLHYRAQSAAAPQAWGSVLAASDLDTGLADFQTRWRDEILPRMSVRYKVTEYRIRSITGWTIAGVPQPIDEAFNETPIRVTTPTNTDLVTGEQVTISGVLGNTAANGTWTITVIGQRAFTLDGSAGNAPYAGSGVWFRTSDRQRLVYGDEAIIAGNAADVGTQAGDALPLFDTWSIFKRAVVAGRHWRGGIRMSPIAESVNINGRVTPAEQLLRDTALANVLSLGINPGGGATNRLYMGVFSRFYAFQAAATFTESNSMFKLVGTLVSQPNSGSLVRRKPKLTSAINQ